MAQPYVGEIRMWAGSFNPVGWELCNGQLLPISENETLFQLIGTTYGGDGESTFGLPDLQGRVPLHVGNGFNLAEKAGVENVTLTTQQLPQHTHPLLGNPVDGSLPDPGGNLTAKTTFTPNVFLYFEFATNQNFAPSAVTPVGGSQPHENVQPYLTITFIISLFGIFPSPT